LNGSMAALEIVPLQIRKFRLERPSSEDCAWLQQTLDRQCRRFDARVTLSDEQRLALSWPATATVSKSGISDDMR
jgi:poly-gamma-glutamate synthesis protein (capsule biosynthesis protein)